MASLAKPQAHKGKADRQPISTHPAFPFIVALWFAALLGIGSLVVPVSLIESLLSASGLAAVVPQAAPPLGVTASLLIALTSTVGGGLLGLFVARKVVNGRSAPATSRFDRSNATARRPISAHHELGAEGLDGSTPKGRRALAFTEAEGPSEVFELAPLPGAFAASALDLTPMAAVDDEAAEALGDEMAEPDTALDLADMIVAEDEPAPHTDYAAPQPGFQSLTAAPAIQYREPAMTDRQMFSIATAPEAEQELEQVDVAEDVAEDVVADLHFSPPSLARAVEVAAAPDQPVDDEMDEELQAEAASAAPVWHDGELDDLGLVQLAQRLGSSIARRRELRAEQAVLAAEREAQLAEQAALAAEAALAAVPPAVVAPGAALPVSLSEDFAEDFAQPEDAALAMAAYFGSPAVAEEPEAEAELELEAEAEVEEITPQPVVVPPVVQPNMAGRQVFQPVAAPVATPPALPGLAQIDIAFDDEDEDEADGSGLANLAASFALPLTRAVMPQAEPASDDNISDDNTGNDDAEPDLAAALAANNPFQQRGPGFVRIEDEPEAAHDAIEPAVVFPGATPLGASPLVPARSFARPEAVPQDANEGARGNNEDHERALREALLNLQRMRGVG